MKERKIKNSLAPTVPPPGIYKNKLTIVYI